MKKITALLALSFAFMLTGCNTFRGMGEDLQKAGEKIENAAKK